MSSKSAKNETRSANSGGSRRAWSITGRLTLLYAVSTGALLLSAVGFLYWSLRHNFDVTRYAMLASKIEVLRSLLRDPAKEHVLASEVEHEAPESGPVRYFIRILDEDGQILHQTPGMDALPVTLFSAPVAVSAEPLATIRRELRVHGSNLLLAVRVAGAENEQRIIQMGLDVAAGTALLARYRRSMMIVLVLGLILAAMSGAWVARKGMRPLAEITETAQHITASQLHERIFTARWPAELVNLAAAFDAMLERLEDSFARLAQFSADLAHALRSPINNLRGEAEVALARSRSPEEYEHLLASSLEELERLSRMIEELLFLARADNPSTAMKRVRFDGREQIDAVREFYEALAIESHVDVNCEGRSFLLGDPMLFRRALSNLLANSLRCTPAGGSVRIQLRTLQDNCIEVCVTDSGRGIAPEHLPKVFDRFYSVGQRRSQMPGGTGLGLAIVRSIMRLHGGDASVKSVLGEGTSVRLLFPPLPSD